jgi:hypothetical protein
MLAPVSGQPCRVEQRVSIEVSNRRVDSWVLTKRRKMAPHVPCSFFGSLGFSPRIPIQIQANNATYIILCVTRLRVLAVTTNHVNWRSG